MKLLIIAEKESDLLNLLKNCNLEITVTTPNDAVYSDLSIYDSYCLLTPEKILDARLRNKLEQENAKGKRILSEAVGSFLDIYSAPPKSTVHSRLIYLEPTEDDGVTGLRTGDLLDDQCNITLTPYFMLKDSVPLLVYRDYVIAHTHTNMSREEILKDSLAGLWLCNNNTVMMSSFKFENFNKARFAPRKNWLKLITYAVEWLTGEKPKKLPDSLLSHRDGENISNYAEFEKLRKETVEKGIKWLNGFLVDNGKGGIREGLHHDIDPDGNQKTLPIVRTDCTGESSGAFKMFGKVYNSEKSAETGGNLQDFVFNPMIMNGGLFDGMMRWTSEAWGVCYQDDVARAILPTLYDCVFFKNDKYFKDVKRVLDFLIKTTAKDGTRIYRTDNIELNETAITNLASKEEGFRCAHYNAYYSAALLLAYKYCGDERYLEVGKRGLETIMSIYPNTVREQSETQENCRLILPLAILYYVTGLEEHREMLYRVTRELQKVRHDFGGYKEWDTDYKATRNCYSKNGECSVLTENGDPVADLLYSCNFLPLGFAFAYMTTKDEWFNELWHGIVEFFIKTQIVSENSLIDGAWCRAFDMDAREIYAAPHDNGWATCSCETGWTCAEILMGMLFPDYIKKPENK